mgnify:CR=1 FL=1
MGLILGQFSNIVYIIGYTSKKRGFQCNSFDIFLHFVTLFQHLLTSQPQRRYSKNKNSEKEV